MEMEWAIECQDGLLVVPATVDLIGQVVMTVAIHHHLATSQLQHDYFVVFLKTSNMSLMNGGEIIWH